LKSKKESVTMLEEVDLAKSLDKKEYKKLMPALRNRLYSLQKAAWDAKIPVIILFQRWTPPQRHIHPSADGAAGSARIQTVSHPSRAHLRAETSMVVALLAQAAWTR
jgi:hypothetical protein